MKLVKLAYFILIMFAMRRQECDAVLIGDFDLFSRYPNGNFGEQHPGMRYIQTHRQGNTMSQDQRRKLLTILLEKIENLRESTTLPSPPEYWLLRQG